jgi:hypothetical protein
MGAAHGRLSAGMDFGHARGGPGRPRLLRRDWALAALVVAGLRYCGRRRVAAGWDNHVDPAHRIGNLRSA